MGLEKAMQSWALLRGEADELRLDIEVTHGIMAVNTN